MWCSSILLPSPSFLPLYEGSGNERGRKGKSLSLSPVSPSELSHGGSTKPKWHSSDSRRRSISIPPLRGLRSR